MSIALLVPFRMTKESFLDISGPLPPLSLFPTVCTIMTCMLLLRLKNVNFFNTFFNSVFVHSCSSPPTIDLLPEMSSDQSMSSITVTEEVWEILSTLNPQKAIGPDRIGPVVLKACAVLLTPPLCQLFNLCLSTASLPEEWKQHLITPV